MFLLACLALLAPAAHAEEHDFATAAKARMNLSFDNDAVQAELAAPMAAPTYAAPGRPVAPRAVAPRPVLPLEANSTLDHVVVMRDRAIVTRTREVKLAAGPQRVRFDGLPLGLAADALYARVRDGKARVVGVELVTGVGESSRPLPTLDVVKGTLGWVGEAERDLAVKLRVDEERAKELGDDLEPLLVKLRDPLATGMTVQVDLDVAAASTVDLALVSQTTGEPWTTATLQLSTADPVAGGTAPTLAAWVLDESGMDASQFTASSGERTGAGAQMLDVAGRRTIAGDGSEARIPLSAGIFPTVVSLTTVPRRVPAVFRSAHVTWTGESPLLPGPVASFVGADYVGSANLLAVAPGEAMDLGFGVDERLKVDRKLADRQVEYLLGGRTRYTVRYVTTVQNFGKAPQTVTLSDQLPVSQIEKVAVVMLSSTPAVTDPNDPPGVLRWPLTIAPGGTATVELAFTVTAPREQAYRLDQMMY